MSILSVFPLTIARSIAVAAVGLAGLVCAPEAYAQQDDLSWIRFPGSNYNKSPSDVLYDREFVKEWESLPPKGYPTLSTENIAPMNAAIKRYTDIVAKGGWQAVPEVQMQIGTTHEAVAILNQRLLMSGDLKEATSFPSNYDFYTEKAVKRFQASNGLTPTGVVDKRTIAALNVPAAVRLKQLKSNLGRLTDLSRQVGKTGRYVLVNIPAAQIEAIENGQVSSRHSGVVGKQDRQTPILRSAIHELNFNPVWHVPPTVIEKDLVPKGQQMSRANQDVLAKYKIDAFDGSGRKLDSARIDWNSPSARNLTFKQQPGPENPMGFVKINFNNAHSVYMHDTPSESLFGRNFRAASSGCVRVQGVDKFAAWLMGPDGGTLERVHGLKKSGERHDVKLKKPVPLYFAYITAWATEDGVIQFRRDLYDKDGVGQIASTY
jgi:L,D-transpeptidase YcbB